MSWRHGTCRCCDAADCTNCICCPTTSLPPLIMSLSNVTRTRVPQSGAARTTESCLPYDLTLTPSGCFEFPPPVCARLDNQAALSSIASDFNDASCASTYVTGYYWAWELFDTTSTCSNVAGYERLVLRCWVAATSSSCAILNSHVYTIEYNGVHPVTPNRTGELDCVFFGSLIDPCAPPDVSSSIPNLKAIGAGVGFDLISVSFDFTLGVA